MHFFNNSVNLDTLPLKGRVLLAPLAGVTDIPFRRICQELGASLTYVEMLSAAAICHQNQRTVEMRARHKDESVLGVQLTGNKPEEIAQAIEILDKEGFDTIDINMGCPVRKVVSTGAGSGILKEPERISKTVKFARTSTQKPLSVKVRLGYTRDTINIGDTIQRVCEQSVNMYTIHGRARNERYDTPCDYASIATGIAASTENAKKILKVGNGDVFCLDSAQKMCSSTNCDAIMVSRGAMGNPWVFSQIRGLTKDHPTFEEWLEVVSRHLDYQEEHYGNTSLAAILMRKHLIWYAKGFPNAKALRERLNHIKNLDEARQYLKDFAQTLPKNFTRYDTASNETFTPVEDV